MFIVYNKNTRTTSLWYFCCKLGTYFTPFLVSLLLTLDKKMLAGKTPQRYWNKITYCVKCIYQQKNFCISLLIVIPYD